jgi:hypothetical protein
VPYDRIDPVDADRSVAAVPHVVLSPVEREAEREKRERARRERARREAAGRETAPEAADPGPDGPPDRPHVDVRA